MTVRVVIPWTLVLVAAAGLIAMRIDVQNLKTELSTKANRELVTAQYEALVQRLDRIERKLDAQRP